MLPIKKPLPFLVVLLLLVLVVPAANDAYVEDYCY